MSLNRKAKRRPGGSGGFRGISRCLLDGLRAVYLPPSRTSHLNVNAMKTGAVSIIGLTFGGVAVGRPAPRAAGQRIDSPYRFLDHGQYVGLSGGYAWLSDGRIGNGPEPAPLVGAHWAMRVSGPFALAADVGFMKTTRVVRDTAFVAADSMFAAAGEADMYLLTAMGSLRFNITGARTWHGIQPFAVLGGGVALDLASESDDDRALPSDGRFDMGTSFAGQLGAGVDWFPSQRVSIRIDARNLLWKIPIPDLFRATENGMNLPDSEWEQNFALSAGLSIHF